MEKLAGHSQKDADKRITEVKCLIDYFEKNERFGCRKAKLFFMKNHFFSNVGSLSR